jgi:hypothetical protein
MAQTVVAGEELDMETVEGVLTDCEEEWTASECGCCCGSRMERKTCSRSENE